MATPTSAPVGAGRWSHPGSDPSLATEIGSQLVASLDMVLRGKHDAVRQAVAAVLSGGHLLLEDVPGQGKTLLAKAIARALGGAFRRIQGTADLLPSEVTGVSVYQPGSGTWEFKPGPLFANVVLVDEINRATPRAQSALLEAMEERQVSVDGFTYRLPEPFVVVATQNPIDHAGTFPLVEGQRDRFALVLQLGHPGPVAERELLLGIGGTNQLARQVAVVDPVTLSAAISAVRQVRVSPMVADHIVAIGEATRGHRAITLGQSPRASLSLLRCAQAWAVLDGRDFVVPDDVRQLAPAALAHRLRGGGDLAATAAIVHEVLARVPVPRG
jgi:MoxR-like ATPase